LHTVDVNIAGRYIWRYCSGPRQPHPVKMADAAQDPEFHIRTGAGQAQWPDRIYRDQPQL